LEIIESLARKVLNIVSNGNPIVNVDGDMRFAELLETSLVGFPAHYYHLYQKPPFEAMNIGAFRPALPAI